MGLLRILLAILILLPMPGRASEDRLLWDFAACAGRFSAELEHAWLVDTGRADDIERRRLTFIDLLNAAGSAAQQRHALNLRIEAKVAHASLLTRAAFSQDRAEARWALRQAESQIAYCDGFLLES